MICFFTCNLCILFIEISKRFCYMNVFLFFLFFLNKLYYQSTVYCFLKSCSILVHYEHDCFATNVVSSNLLLLKRKSIIFQLSYPSQEHYHKPQTDHSVIRNSSNELKIMSAVVNKGCCGTTGNLCVFVPASRAKFAGEVCFSFSV